MNTIAFHSRGCCSIEDFADEFKTTPGRLKKTLQQLEEAGLIKVTGNTYQQIEPTKKLLQEQDKHLSDHKAAKLVGQYKRGNMIEPEGMRCVELISEDETMQSHEVKEQEQLETLSERIYTALMGAKRMGPQLTAKAIALIIQNLHKHQLISDEELDEFLRPMSPGNPGGRQKPR